MKMYLWIQLIGAILITTFAAAMTLRCLLLPSPFPSMCFTIMTIASAKLLVATSLEELKEVYLEELKETYKETNK